MDKPDKWLSDPENLKFVNFLVEKTKEGKTVLNVQELAKEFKMENKCLIKRKSLEQRIRRFRLVAHQFPHLDIDTKVKILFGLSALLDQRFLEELRKEAVVIVDDFNRIVHYRKNDGSLHLEGNHYSRKANDEIGIQQILEFLAEKVKETSEIHDINEFCEQFKTETGDCRDIDQLEKLFLEARDHIFKSELFDEEMKVRMMFATSAVVSRSALKKLRKNANVKLDYRRRIREYESFDKVLQLKGKHSYKSKEEDEKEEEDEDVKTPESSNSNGSMDRLKRDPEVTVDDSRRIVHHKKNGLKLNGEHKKKSPESSISESIYTEILVFLAQKVNKTSGVLDINEFCCQFKIETGDCRNIDQLEKLFREARDHIFKSELFGEKMKARMMFAASAVVPDHVIRKLRKNATVKIDKRKRIIEYESFDDVYRLYGRHSLRKSRKNRYEELKRTIRMAGWDKLVDEYDSSDDENEKEKQIDFKRRKMDSEPSNSNGNNSKKGHEDSELMKPNNNNNNTLLPGNNEHFVIPKQEESWMNVKIEEPDPIDKEIKSEPSSIIPSVDGILQLETAHKSRKIHSSKNEKEEFKRRKMDFEGGYEDVKTPSDSNEGNKISLDEIRNSVMARMMNIKARKLHQNGAESGLQIDQTSPQNSASSFHDADEKRIKLEPFDGPLNDDTTRLHIINNGDDFVEEIPAPTQNFVAPKQEEFRMGIKIEEPDFFAFSIPIKSEVIEEVKPIID